MAKPTTTFFDELVSALQGCFALLVGNRQAPSFFDFSQRGLIGSLIATIIGIALAGFGPLLLGVNAPSGTATQSVVINGVLFVAQAATAFLALRQMGRQDGFVPYLVASNWVTLASAILMLISTLFGPAGMIVLVLVIVLAIASFVNIGRHIVTLTGWQIVLLFISQAVGVFIALAVIALLAGPPPGV